MEDITKRPKVGVGVIVKKDGKVLMQKRKGAHGFGTWCFPGGHMEFGESLEETARRETIEELGIEITNIWVGPYTNDVHTGEGKHYVTLFVVSDYASGDPKIMEPDKTEFFDWFDWEEMPRPLFLPIINLLEQGYNPFK
ncbi:MAG: hypothetical protein UR53_C0001G0081 [Candidatus Magasanikbacteria bacterium GW2011_GWC2_34_16]|uniref:Nudix hydrolase domain-containing protein n=2 Tax=Candidatus Magasanikiibacteriota TaxID=1752731 RepID=A0A0G0JW93_9BACT|nr:MAG: hypothetical protein UR53_C0001G0081 [Candidatus Magasanikbacteria bacterium GW2011_GWC2_34_16]KKQ41109.1 MAG: hypothetical protein US58_C0005G0034 [Candidatus Magasanikbacteria bacterium GW2011_GWA2_37_8]